jgi:[ribosomal protein S18]-alanine N-acetyltransferase
VRVTLREYTPNDFEAIWKLDQICFAENIAYSRDEMRMYLALRSSFCIIAEVDGTLAGFTIMDHRPSRPGYMVTIDVAPEMRRYGVATALLQEVETRLQRAGGTAIRLEVAINNQGAIDFYKRHGFRDIGRKPGYYNGQLDALSMKKELTKTELS